MSQICNRSKQRVKKKTRFPFLPTQFFCLLQLAVYGRAPRTPQTKLVTNALSHRRRLTRCPVCYEIVSLNTFPGCHLSHAITQITHAHVRVARQRLCNSYSDGCFFHSIMGDNTARHDLTQQHRHGTLSSLNCGGWPYCTIQFYIIIQFAKDGSTVGTFVEKRKIFARWVKSYRDVTCNYNTNMVVDFRVWCHGKVWRRRRRRIFHLIIAKLLAL